MIHTPEGCIFFAPGGMEYTWLLVSVSPVELPKMEKIRKGQTKTRLLHIFTSSRQEYEADPAKWRYKIV
jgi:hypothetical protein